MSSKKFFGRVSWQQQLNTLDQGRPQDFLQGVQVATYGS
jgi:hypothetical protein